MFVKVSRVSWRVQLGATTVVSQANREKTTKGRANNRGTMAGLVAPAIAVYAVQTNARSLTDSKHETSHPCPLVFALETGVAHPSAQEFYTVNCVTGLTAIFHSNHLRFDLATREKRYMFVIILKKWRIFENFELSAIWIEKYLSKIKSNFLWI